jgi:hypothetical protein
MECYRVKNVTKMLGTMACNQQKRAIVVGQLLPFSYIFRNGRCSRTTYAAFTVLQRLEVTMPCAAANFITQSRKEEDKEIVLSLSFALSRLCVIKT